MKTTLFLVMFLASSMVEPRKKIKSIDNFSEWCDEDPLFKPYVKYYFGGRLKALETGIPDMTHGPGQHYDFLSHKNTYVCINGLAWMYYANVTSAGLLVLIQPELHIYKHVCMLTNYDLDESPGWTTPRNESVPLPMLYSILLMGDGVDYRKPSLELISAPTAELSLDPASADATGPLIPKKPLRYINGTSFVIIGDDMECKLRKGATRVRVRSGLKAGGGGAGSGGGGSGGGGATPTPAPEQSHDIFCKFSYSRLTETLAATTLLTDKNEDIADNKEILKAAAILQGDLVKEGCFVPDNYTEATIEVVKARKIEIDAFGDPAKNPKSVLVGKPSEYFKDEWDPAKPYLEGTTYKDVIDLVDSTDDPCLVALEEVVQKCTVVAPKTECDPPPTKVEKCDPAAALPSVPCDPCDPSNPALQKYIKILEENVKFLKKVDPPPADAAKEIGEANKAILTAKLKRRGRSLWQVQSFSTGGGDAGKKNPSAPTPPDPSAPAPAPAPDPSTGGGRKRQTATGGAASGSTKIYEDTKDAWDITKDPMKALQTYVDEVKKDPVAKTPAELKELKRAATTAITSAQMLLNNLHTFMRLAKEEYAALARDVTLVAGGGTPTSAKKEAPVSSGVITVAREEEANFIQPLTQVNKDPTMYPPDTSKTCGKLPNLVGSCADAKPTGDRAVQLLAARMGQYSDGTADVTWKPEDAWREGILNYVADIFSKSCEPMVKPVYAQEINSVIKGYLLNTVKGTLKSISVTVQKDAACTQADPAKDPPCEMVTEECDPVVHKDAKPTPPTFDADGNCPLAPLPPRRAYWAQLENALRHCKDSERVLKFKRKYNNEDKDQPFDAFIYTLMGKPYKELVIKDNIEQADLEYAFNYVIDSFWRMFATSLALCMPYIEKELPDVGRQYYAMFTEDFLYPLAKEWRNNRDNPVFELIYGAYYNKKTDYWAKMCMEAAFVRTGDVRWRPPRKLLVNGRSEMNYFVQGPVFDLGVKRIYGDHWEVGRFG